MTGGGEREAGEVWQVQVRGNMASPASICFGSCPWVLSTYLPSGLMLTLCFMPFPPSPTALHQNNHFTGIRAALPFYPVSTQRPKSGQRLGLGLMTARTLSAVLPLCDLLHSSAAPTQFGALS